MARPTRSTPSGGAYGMPICPSRSGRPVPSARTTRSGAISSMALTVIASRTGWRVYGFSAPSATRMSGTCAAMADT